MWIIKHCSLWYQERKRKKKREKSIFSLWIDINNILSYLASHVKFFRSFLWIFSSDNSLNYWDSKRYNLQKQYMHRSSRQETSFYNSEVSVVPITNFTRPIPCYYISEVRLNPNQLEYTRQILAIELNNVNDTDIERLFYELRNADRKGHLDRLINTDLFQKTLSNGTKSMHGIRVMSWAIGKRPYLFVGFKRKSISLKSMAYMQLTTNQLLEIKRDIMINIGSHVYE
jgi:hypothetical protein